jgi:hypothetical protein
MHLAARAAQSKARHDCMLLAPEPLTKRRRHDHPADAGRCGSRAGADRAAPSVPPVDTITTRVAWQGIAPRARRFDSLRFERVWRRAAADGGARGVVVGAACRCLWAEQ